MQEVPAPTPLPHELLVRVHATTVNRTDCGYRSGKPFVVRFFSGVPRPRARIWGNEFAGVVVDVGSGVSKFVVGDRVFGYVEGRFGAHAELLTVAETASVALMPASVTFEQAAAGTEGSHYALSFLQRAGFRDGDTVLVNGATGAIGSALVQLAKARGATVTAVTDTDHVALVEGLGADRVVDYLKVDFTLDEQRYDSVLDAVGKSTFNRCRGLLKPGGVYLSSELGPGWQNPPLALVTPLLRAAPLLDGKTVVFPYPGHDQETIRQLAASMERGDFTPVIDRTYPLEQIVEAYRYVETGRKVGNVVITVLDAAEGHDG